MEIASKHLHGGSHQAAHITSLMGPAPKMVFLSGTLIVIATMGSLERLQLGQAKVL